MKRRAFTLVEMLVVIVIIGMLIAILLPALGRVLELARRVKCAANLQGLGKVLIAYAAEDPINSSFPDTGRPGQTYSPVTNALPINTTGCMWILVLTGKAQPETFICPTALNDGKVDIFTGLTSSGTYTVPTAATPFPRSAKDRITLSYSYQVPHPYWDGNNNILATNNPGRAETGNQDKLAVMADISPFDDPAAIPPAPGKLLTSLSGWGAFNTAASSNISTYGTNLQNFASQSNASVNGTNVRGLANYFSGDSPNPNHLNSYIFVNSNNHRGEGQNVLYRDGHVAWAGSPCAGVNYDNIYTRATGAIVANVIPTTRVIGTVPDVSGGNCATPYDVNDSYLRTWPLPPP